ncbi:RCC1/BLIP-II [Microstroma glucosiphilum]|uniref:RCC1/BLIP-II n=1 Tax=Pseudomicrostroma glucosiphilum TaxID=1684307 RepID=A0A316U867_9BASI|nr:RCC1/BLIP-II [Pseudomicrostroma glucosiphilum]PWN21427.1 RCC1/BLIP-II [Pseudomicrostroma glucosiphilum]
MIARQVRPNATSLGRIASTPHRQAVARHLRQTRAFTSRSPPSSSARRVPTGTSAAVVTAIVASALVYKSQIHNDAAPLSDGANPVADMVTPTTISQQDQMRARASQQGVYTWGSNRYNVVAPDSPATTLVKTPRSIPFFAGMALRDVVLEEKHAVAVDAHGDVLQWGLGFFDATSRALTENIEEAPLGRRREKERANELFPKGSEAVRPRDPVKTLVGKDIIKVAANDTKVFALSRKGDLYVFSASHQAQKPRSAKGSWSANPLSLFGTLSHPEIDHEKISFAPSVSLARGDRLAQIAAGSSHLIALSSKGRTFSLPIDSNGNIYGQLGSRKVILNAPATPGSKATKVDAVLEPRILGQASAMNLPANAVTLPSWALPPGKEAMAAKSQPKSTATTPAQASAPAYLSEPGDSIRFCTTLSEIPSLRQVAIADIAVGNEHNLARTHDGRVVAWGRHTHGQLGLGANMSIECVPVPSEVVLAKAFSGSSRDVKCTGIAAGGDNSFFVTERREEGRLGTGKSIDVLASGKGQWGTLGNAMWSQVKPDPSRVKTVSGLMEYSERSNLTHPVPIKSIAVGRPGHVALVLDTVETEGHAAFGRDVMVFGHNAAYQLGTGKRSNLAVPQHLHPLPPPTPTAGAPAPDTIIVSTKLAEADINSGALTHMPHNRLQLASETKNDTKGAPSETGKTGKAKKGVKVEEMITAGTVSMAVWWKCEA